MSSALQDEADPIYSHFGHRTEFLELLEQFMAVDVGCQASKVEDERERDLIGSLGATVGATYKSITDDSSTTISLCPVYWIPRSMPSFPL
jgi:hypothetical protein